MAIALVIALSSGSGAGEPATSLPTVTAAPEKCPAGSKPAGAGCIDVKPVFIENCPGVRKALRFYTKRWQHWTSLRTGASQAKGQRYGNQGIRSRGRLSEMGLCPRYLLKIRQAKARAAHEAWNRYFDYHYAWSHWLPQKWYRIGICETGLNWRHSNSSYEGAFGFALSSWDAFVPRADPKAGPYPSNAYMATPRQQYEVALAIYRMFGFSGWGCRGA